MSSHYNTGGGLGSGGEDVVVGGQLGIDGSAGDLMGPSDTDDDDEEHLDCVHDIHGDGEEADVEDVENGVDPGSSSSNHLMLETVSDHHVRGANKPSSSQQQQQDMMEDDSERPLVHDSSMEEYIGLVMRSSVNMIGQDYRLLQLTLSPI